MKRVPEGEFSRSNPRQRRTRRTQKLDIKSSDEDEEGDCTIDFSSQTMTPVCSDVKVRKTPQSDKHLKDVMHSIVLEPPNLKFQIGKPNSQIMNENPHIITMVFSFLICDETTIPASHSHIPQVCKKWANIYNNSSQLWDSVKDELTSGEINWNKLRFQGKHNEGTEGILYKVTNRPDGQAYAMKRARVYPQGEGVPYYMIRELAVLRGLAHPRVAAVERVHLRAHRLHVFFRWVPTTLHDYLNPGADSKRGLPLPETAVRNLLKQLLEAVAYCHRRGVLHRNLKPKHLLVEGAASPAEVEARRARGDHPGLGAELEKARLKLTDFALVRLTGYPRRAYTNEVVTLWYRPPEILMGVRDYLPAVDLWSVGCIFAEMVLGRPIFTGVSEVDQLFQIFSKLSTPDRETWPDFTALPNYNFNFPNWTQKRVGRLFPHLSTLGLDLMRRLLTYDPARRVTAKQALRHPYFAAAPPLPRPCGTPTFSSDCTGGRKKPRAGGGEPVPADHGTPAERNLIQNFDANLTNGLLENMLEYLDHLREQEDLGCPQHGQLFGKQDTIRPEHRSMLVDWLVEVVDVFEMSQRTAFLAIAYVDRYMASTTIDRKQYQLIGATCLHIASKCEDVSYIGIDDLAMCADSVFKPMDVLDKEEEVLNALGFTLSCPTVLDFVALMVDIARFHKDKPEENFVHFCKYLSEMCILNHEFMVQKPSRVALSIIVYALYVYKQNPWPPEMRDLSPYPLAGLRETVEQVHRFHRSMFTHQLQVIRRRYLKDEVGRVARVPAPSALDVQWGLP